jgi:CHAT domain-containing protein
MDSRLFFADRAVRLEELRRTLLPGARRLAVLSACLTNVTGAAMPNEMVGLPSAFIELGFAGVIASAWQVDDLATTYLMTALYHYWRQDGHEPVVALNRAQRWLRTATHAELVATLPGIEPEGNRASEHPLRRRALPGAVRLHRCLSHVRRKVVKGSTVGTPLPEIAADRRRWSPQMPGNRLGRVMKLDQCDIPNSVSEQPATSGRNR